MNDMNPPLFPPVGGVLLLVLLQTGPVSGLNDIPQYRTRSDPGCHTEGIYPATVRIQNLEQSTGYSVEICPGEEVHFSAPRVVLRPGFKATRGSRFRAGVPVIDVQVVVVEECATYPDYPGSPSPPNPNPAVCTAGTGRHFLHPQDMQQVIDELNRNFYTVSGDQLVKFRLKSVTEWNDIVAAGLANSALIGYITSNSHSYGSPDDYGDKIEQAYLDTPDNILRDHSALNFYVYDSGHTDLGADTGHGRNNADQPYVLIDYDRWGAADPQNPVSHEIGHALGLGHTVSELVLSASDPSNLMCAQSYTSTACGGVLAMAGLSGGNRLLGLEFEPYIDCTCVTPPCARKDQESDRSYGQAEIALWNAIEIAQKLGLINSSLPIRVPWQAVGLRASNHLRQGRCLPAVLSFWNSACLSSLSRTYRNLPCSQWHSMIQVTSDRPKPPRASSPHSTLSGKSPVAFRVNTVLLQKCSRVSPMRPEA